jgi:hypothetical protein
VVFRVMTSGIGLEKKAIDGVRKWKMRLLVG